MVESCARSSAISLKRAFAAPSKPMPASLASLIAISATRRCVSLSAAHAVASARSALHPR